MKKTKDTDNKLTDGELELMSILWKLGEGSVAEVMDHLPKNRDLAYTSVSTILRILEQKEIVTTRKEGRGHIYIPKLKKSDYESKTLQQVVNRVFDGTPVALVRQLLESVPLNEADFKELKAMIEQAGGRK